MSRPKTSRGARRGLSSARARSVRLLLLDVDGTLTDRGIYLDDAGRQMQRFDASDGAGIKMLMREGVDVAIISGRRSRAVTARAKDLGIRNVLLGKKVKLPAVRALLRRLGLAMEEAAFAGDDLVDLPAMRAVGWSAAPSDARAEVRAEAAFVARGRGGHGAVREICERLLKLKGLWKKALARYMPGGAADGGAS